MVKERTGRGREPTSRTTRNITTSPVQPTSYNSLDTLVLSPAIPTYRLFPMDQRCRNTSADTAAIEYIGGAGAVVSNLKRPKWNAPLVVRNSYRSEDGALGQSCISSINCG